MYMENIYIYALLDPSNNKIRYIGQTNNLKRRLNEHIYNSKKNNKNDHKSNWIKSLLSNDLEPQILLIEECSLDTSNEREIYWINQYDDLTNGTTGGNNRFKMTESVRNKLKVNNSGKNNPCYGKVWGKEERLKLSKQRKGRVLSEDWKDKISESLGFKCVVDGVEYNSIKEIKKKLNHGWNYIKKRLDDEKYPNWFYVK